MSYSSIGTLALVIHLIINRDVLFRKMAENETKAYQVLRLFLFTAAGYFAADSLWGFFSSHQFSGLLYADSVVYFFVKGLAILFWTHYVVLYIQDKESFGTILPFAGRILFAVEMIFLMANFFTPVLFSIDADGNYVTGAVRAVLLVVETMVFMVAGLYTLLVAPRAVGTMQGRHRTIGTFGLVMGTVSMIQSFHPLYPIYSMGLLVGICLIHTFVLEDEKEEYKNRLEEVLRREVEQQDELDSAKHAAYTDPLTGVKSKHAYIEIEEKLDHLIAIGSVKEFGIVVFDLNGLKYINDTLGHEAGDSYIQAASKMICDHFKHSPVFRIGGDEFAVILERQDYENRRLLLETFDAQIQENIKENKVSVATGMAVFERGRDHTYHAVFKRADERMYHRKQELKQMGARMRE